MSRYHSNVYEWRTLPEGAVRFAGGQARAAMTALIVFAFFIGTLSPFLLQPGRSLASAGIPAEVAALGDLLGTSAESLSASICHHDDDAPAGNRGGNHDGEHNCCLCHAFGDLLHALPPADGSILMAAQAGGPAGVSTQTLTAKRHVARAGFSRAPPALFEVSAV